ncbi:MAG: hypothetical protein AB7H90_01425 [Alphaproteobacteria bacterium]
MTEKTGVPVIMGGEKWYIPPLTLGLLRKHASALAIVLKAPSLSALMSEEEIDAVCEVASAAMSRNYSDMTVERIAEMVDLKNISDVVTAILTGTGMSQPGEAQPVVTGETKASPNGSMMSTAPSLPAADTAPA